MSRKTEYPDLGVTIYDADALVDPQTPEEEQLAALPLSTDPPPPEVEEAFRRYLADVLGYFYDPETGDCYELDQPDFLESSDFEL